MNVFENEAKKFFKKRLPVIPCRGKVPSILEWSSHSLENYSESRENQLIGQYSNHNIGIVLGANSGLVAVDVDSDDPVFLEKIKSILPETSVVRVGKKGFAAIYSYSNEKSQKFKKGKRPLVEILSDGNQLILPPSVHPETRKPYTYISTKELHEVIPNELPKLSNEIIFKIQSLCNGTELIEFNEDELSEGRNDKLKKIVLSRIKKNQNIDSIIREVIDFDSVNHRKPLFSDPTEAIGGLDCYTNALVFITNITKSINRKRINDGLLPYSPIFELNKSIDIKLTPLKDLFNEDIEKEDYLVDGLLPTGGFSILFAKPKAGKSVLARNLCEKVSTGSDFLGRSSLKGVVAYLALEEKRSEIKKHFSLLDLDQRNIFIHTGMLENNPEVIKSIIKNYEPKLIIIDTLNVFLRLEDSNSYSEVVNRLQPFIDIARDTGTHLMFVHHSRKEDSKPFDSILGSTAILSSVDTAIHLKRNETESIIRSKQRYGVDFPETVLNFCLDTKSFSVGYTKQSQNFNRIKNLILDLLGSGDEFSQKEIFENLKSRTDTKKKALNYLYVNNLVNRIGEGKRGSEYRYSINKESISSSEIQDTGPDLF